MNNYPKWWDKTITIYNKFEDPLTQLITWYKTIVTNCFWKDEHINIRVRLRDFVLEGDNVICRIPKSNKYVDAETWNNLTADAKSRYFTIGYNDIIVLGEVADEINEYQSGYRSSDLLGKYKKLQKCLEVDSFSDNTGDNLDLEHYLVRGI